MVRIRKATADDIKGIGRLLSQVLEVHHAGRPDLFRPDVRKYTDEQLEGILADDTRPIFVAVPNDDAQGAILGYAFCVHQIHPNDNILTDIRTLYVDDLCVDEACRGTHVGSALFAHVRDYARKEGFYNITLNVWACNEPAQRFYEHLGLVPQKIGMELIV